MKKRGIGYKSKISWYEMVSLYGRSCAYCLEEPAQSIDHIVPWSYSYCDEIWNLRPCCLWCNLHAGDKMFESFEAKQDFLRKKRMRGRSAVSRTVCTTCFLPYQRPHMTTSMFECPICDPFKQNQAQKSEWNKFLYVMKAASIRIDFHGEVREMRRRGIGMKTARSELGEMYIASILGDGDGSHVLFDMSVISS